MRRYSLRNKIRGAPISDPRDFERNTGYVGRQSGAGDNSSGWIIAAIVAVVLLGLAAYSYRDTREVAATDPPATTSGQSTRAPVPATPPAAPVAPAPRSQ
jgi:hypothetical protein